MSASPAPQPFDPGDLQSKGLAAHLVSKLVDNPQWLFAILRRVCPIPRVAGWAMVTRYDDVAEVLRADHAFAVPFGPKVETLNGGPNFLLGMADAPDYRRLRDLVSRLFPQDENASRVARISGEVAARVVAEAGGRLDAVQDLITHVPIRVCEAYYGVEAPDTVAFGQWTIAMSTYMFGDPANNPNTKRAALAGGAQLRRLVDAAIARARAGNAPPDTIAARMAADPSISDEEARSILIGMITGFVPTNTMAAGHMLEMLLRRPDFLAAAQSAARADDDAALTSCLFEAFRFKPLNPGPFRACVEDYEVAAGTPRATRLKAGTRLIAGTQSAMFDPRRIAHPTAFDPGRAPSDYMLFGFGLHWCVGARLAEAQITQTFKRLLLRPGLRREAGAAGKLQRLGPFPAHLHVRYDA
jgi:cytochrome P450